MERRVTNSIAPARADAGRGAVSLGPDGGGMSGRTAVTEADEGVAPTARGAAQLGSPATTSTSVGVAHVTHEVVRGQLSDYLDGTLGEAARHRVDGHLAGCPSCVAYRDSLLATIRGLGKLPAPKAPHGAASRIIERVRRDPDAAPPNA